MPSPSCNAMTAIVLVYQAWEKLQLLKKFIKQIKNYLIFTSILIVVFLDRSKNCVDE